MPDPQLDPSKGVLKWSAQRAHQHLVAVVTGAIVIPLAAAVAGLFLALPPHPTAADRILQLFEALGVGLLLVAALAFLYAVLLAPYEQRRALRSELQVTTSKYNELVEGPHKGLVLSDMTVNREVVPGTNLTARLTFHLQFRNGTDIAVEYQIKELSVTLQNNEKVQHQPPDQSYRIWPNSTQEYIFFGTYNPPQALAGFDTKLEYVVWYGPVTEPTAYEQHCIYGYRDLISSDQSRTKGQLWREPGGHDELRVGG